MAAKEPPLRHKHSPHAIAQAITAAQAIEAGEAWQRLPAGSSTIDPKGYARLDALYIDLQRRSRFIVWFTRYYHSAKISVAIAEFIQQLERLEKEAAKWSSSK